MTVTTAYAEALHTSPDGLLDSAGATTTLPARAVTPSRLRRAAGFLEDGFWLLLVVYAFPFAILAVMMPFVAVVFLVRWLVS